MLGSNSENWDRSDDVPQTAARLYGNLSLSAEPVSLDRITSDLEISKASASAAARSPQLRWHVSLAHLASLMWQPQ